MFLAGVEKCHGNNIVMFLTGVENFVCNIIFTIGVEKHEGNSHHDVIFMHHTLVRVGRAKYMLGVKEVSCEFNKCDRNIFNALNF